MDPHTSGNSSRARRGSFRSCRPPNGGTKGVKYVADGLTGCVWRVPTSDRGSRRAAGEVVMPSRLTPFIGWVSAALVVAVIVLPGPRVHAQALEPRSYANSPVGINFVLLGYGYTEGDVGFDASTPITDAKVHVHAGLLASAHSLDVWGLSGKVLAVLPFAEASGSAKVAGQGRDRHVYGLADPLRVSLNLYGDPALS